MNAEAEVLISVKTFSGKGTEVMSEALKNLSRQVTILKASGIYKVDRPAESFVGIRDIRKDERFDGLALVIKAETAKSPAQTLQVLETIEQSLQKQALKRTLSFNLLIYSDQILVLPGLSLPHPEMHLRPEEIIPAVEVWPDCIHPVLNKSLLQLSRKFAKEVWGEYLTQGTSLLDFSEVNV